MKPMLRAASVRREHPELQEQPVRQGRQVLQERQGRLQ